MAKTTKKFPRRRPWCYPIKIYRLPGGKLVPECHYCNGTGRKWIWTSTSDSPGSGIGRMTKHKCSHCGGKGYEENNNIQVIEVKG
jgi:DnaJ-class molecular chaperone